MTTYLRAMETFNATSTSRILIASDSQVDVSLLRSHFESTGYVVEQCSSLRDVYMTDLSGYCLVLLDLSDNIEEGIHAIESIKQNPMSAAIPVLVYSTTRRSDILVNALNAGADDYVIKPFSLRELSARVRAVLRATRRV